MSVATVASLFDGIGGTLLSATMCGATPVWASEIEKFPILVTKHHFPSVKHHGDITKINGAEVEPVDIIVGGSPCQDLSVAGKRKGMKHADFGDEVGTRSGLFMEQIRIIREMRSATNGVSPRFMVWENVLGAFSSNGGEDFRAVLEETAKVADPSVSVPRSVNGWSKAGSILGNDFSVSWRTVDAQYWGVPQRRRRIYLVADFGGQSAPEILFEREGKSGHLAKSGSQGQGVAGDAENGFGAAGFEGKQGSKARRIGIQTERAPTGLAGQESHVICLQGNGIDRADPACNQGGIAICMATGQANAEIMIDMSPTLVAGHEQPIVAGQDCRNSNETGDRSVAKCLKAKANLSFRDDSDTIINNGNTVRRLTPLECCRLQGYPDNYTNIPGASDSARYKALGNSFAIPNAYFVISGCVEKMRIETGEAK